MQIPNPETWDEFICRNCVREHPFLLRYRSLYLPGRAATTTATATTATTTATTSTTEPTTTSEAVKKEEQAPVGECRLPPALSGMSSRMD